MARVDMSSHENPYPDVYSNFTHNCQLGSSEDILQETTR